MTAYVFSPPPVASVAVADSDARFPIRRIFCVGRNYEAHAREMGKDPTREKPFIFMKSPDCAVDNGVNIPYPPETNNFQHEIEFIIAICKDGRNISEENALSHVWGYGVGIDLTRRDLQFIARDAGRPWSWGKGFDKSAPLAPLSPVSKVGHVNKGRIWLAVNGVVKQDQDVADLIWNVEEIITFISHSMELKAGDIIMTGTPSGVGPLVVGDKVTGGITGLGDINITITKPLS